MNIFKWLFNPDWFTFSLGGGGSGPNTTYSQTSNIPEYARPYVEQMLGATQKQLFTGTSDASGNFTPTGFNNFTPYGATYQKDAQGNPLRDSSGNVLYTNTAQQQAQAAVAPVSAGQQMATNTINQYAAPSQTQGATAIAGDIAGRSAASGYYSPLQAERFQLGTPQQVRSDSFTAPGVSQAYMSPYMQNVVNAQQREAARQSQIQRNQNQAQATSQGAFGGSRQAIIEAERQRNLGTQLGDIQGAGLQQAYGQGMGQFNAEQAAYLQAQQANQGANLQAGIQNLQSQQQAQAAQEASRQFGAQLGLQGYGQSLQAAQTLGQLGNQQYQQDMGTIQAMAGMGAQEQAQTQNIINQAMQNYGTAQQYPLMQLGVMSNMLRGLPMQSSTTNMYQAQPSMFNQAAGVVGTGLALAKDYNALGKKEGGVVKMATGGGIATGVNPNHLTEELQGPRFNDKALQQKASDPNTDQATKDLVAAEMARRAGLRAGMATGGIVAFKDGKEVEGKDKKDRDRIEAEKNKEVDSMMYAVPERETSSRPITDKTLYNPNEGAKNAKEERLNKIVEQRKQAEIEGRRILAERDIKDAITDNVAARERKPGGIIPAPVATTPPAPAASVDAPASGITAAPPPGMMDATKLATAQGKDQPSPATRADASVAEEDAGIYGLSSKLPAELKDELRLVTEQQDTADTLRKSTPQLEAEKRRDELTAMGLPSFYDKEQQKIKDKRTANTEQAKSDAEDRLHKFLINWGRTPGSTLRGIVEAGYDLSNQQGLDKKEQRRMEKELDDVSSSLSKAEYERQIGDYDKAKESITKAGQQYYELGIKKAKIVADYKIKTMESADKLEIARLKAEAAANKQGNKAAIIQQADEYFKGLVAEGKPANAVTYKQALIEVNAIQPSVRSAEIGYGPRAEGAGAQTEDAATKRMKEKADQQGKFKLDLFDALNLDKKNRTIISEARERDAKAKRSITHPDSEEAKVTDDITDRVRSNFPLLTAAPKKDAAPAAAAPKKDDKKDVAPAAAPAKPALKWNPKTNKWE